MTAPPPSPDAPLHVVFGAGPLGREVARKLAEGGVRVRLVTRSGQAAGLPPGVEPRAADAADPASAARACEGAAVAYQCAAPPYHRWPELFPPLQESVLQAAARAGAVLVAAENLYGYGVAGELHEGLPLAATTRKGRTRAAMSARLLDAHAAGLVRATAARASDFFGPGARVSALGERAWPALLRGRVVAWLGDPDAPHSFTFLPDFARAMIRLGAEEAAWGRAWHVPSPPPLSPREVLTRAAGLAGAPAPRLRRLPRLALRAAGLLDPAARETVEMAYSFERPFVMRHAAYDRAFGDAPTPWPEALGATLAWWRGALSAPAAG